ADHHLVSPGGAVRPAVLAGLVDIEGMMGVLDRRDGEPARDQLRQEAHEEIGLAAAAPSRKTEDAHRFNNLARRRGQRTRLGLTVFAGRRGRSSVMWCSPARR